MPIKFTPVKIHIVIAHLSPWKGRVNIICFTVAVSKGDDLLQKIESALYKLKKAGKYKRRKTEKISIPFRFNL